jgi:Alpha/beta hydrolase of unknown function (DUF900)
MPSRRSFLSAATAFTCGAVFNRFSQAESLPACSPRQDEMWVVDSHSVGCSEAEIQNPSRWSVQRRETSTCWRASQLTDYFASLQDGKKTVVFVHGNRNDHAWAVRNGQSVYEALVRQAPTVEPFRFVIYAWPADQIRGPVRDARYKTQVANGETYRFAWCLAQTPANVPVGLVSFSLGGRVVTGGLHLLAGGSLHGKALPAGDRPAMRSVCIAPAFDHDWLSQQRYYGQAINTLDTMRVFFNSCDPVLKRYQKLDRCGDAEALGYAGLCGYLGESAARYCESDASRYVGKTHELKQYLYHTAITQEFSRILLWDPVG